MRKNVLLILFVLIYSAIYSQVIPNQNFENWVTTSGIANPVSWATSNTTVMTVTVITVSKDSANPHSGKYCAKIANVSASGIATVPGLMTIGKFTMNIMAQTGTVSGGIPFTSTPARLKGYYEFSPKSGDSCIIAVVFTKRNTSTGKSDTVGVGSLISGDTVTSWKLFNVPISYKPNAAPDTMNITIMSSKGSNPKPQLGSTMYVDSIYLEGTVLTGIDNLYENNNVVNLFPNPAHDIINIQLNNEITGDLNMNIYNSLGEIVLSEIFNSKSNNYPIDISRFHKGFYYLNIYNDKNNYIKKFVVE